MRLKVLLVLSMLPWLLGAKPPAGEADAPCPAEPVRVVRAYAHPPESAELRLTNCDGQPRREALDTLSVLARPDDVERPEEGELERFARTAPAARRERWVARGVRRLHPGLLTRLQKLADRFPGKAIEIVSGYRPKARRTSRHRHARALDLRVDGVHRRKVSTWARSELEDSGVGFYPNSVFTHIDVRHREAYWVDRSGPGEPADYGPWPPSEQEQDEAREAVLADADRALKKLGAEVHDEPEEHDEASSTTASATEAETASATETASAPATASASETASAAETASETAPAAETASATETASANDAPPSDDCEPEAVGGLCGASGVVAAWSFVPADEGEAEGAPDAGADRDGQSRNLPGADSPEGRRIEESALAAIDELAR